MRESIITIIIVLIVFMVFVVLFFFADWFSKGGSKKSAKAKQADIREAKSSFKQEKDIATTTLNTVKNSSHDNENFVLCSESNLADDIEKLINKEPLKKDEKVETASQRSRMVARRAQLQNYYKNKFGHRDSTFSGIDELETVSSNGFSSGLSVSDSSVLIDGIEITKDDIKKLTALQGLLARKNPDNM